MLLKEFSHILNNTRLVVRKVSNAQSNTSTSITLDKISSTVDDIFCKTVNDIIAEASSGEASSDDTTTTPIEIIINENQNHYLTPFDQTQIQTQIMSKYIQVLCYKYGIDETEMEIEVNPIQKNNHLWLSYVCKFPKLYSNDGLKIEEFKNYIDRNGEYHVKGQVFSEIGSKIKIYISKSNEITSSNEFNSAIRTGSYTLAKEDGYSSGEVFDILVKYGCSVLFRADYCNDVMLLSIQNDVAINNITLKYNNSLQGSVNVGRLELSQQLVSGGESTNYNYNSHSYLQLNPRNIELFVDSISEEAYSLLSTNKLQLVLLEATSDKELGINDSNPKVWSVVDRNYLVFNSGALQQLNGIISVINQKNISTLLDSVGMKESLFAEAIQHTSLPIYNSTFYLKCGLRNSETGEILQNVNSNMCIVSCQWRNNPSGSYGFNDGGGNKIIFEVTNTPDQGRIRPSIAETMELAYIYDGTINDKVVPNFIIPNISSNYNYYSEDTWKAYNVYCDPTFNTRSNQCYNGISYEQGSFNSNSVTVNIEYVSYYIDSATPTAYYLQSLIPIDDFSYNLSNTIVTGKDRYDVQHQVLTIYDVPVNQVVKLKSTVNRYVYPKDEYGKVIFKSNDGSFLLNGEQDNYDTNTSTYKTGRVVYLQDTSGEDVISEVQYYIAEAVNNDSYILSPEDEGGNIITKSEASTDKLYADVSCNYVHFIKKLNSTGEIAVQNIFPKGIHHFGIYSPSNNYAKVGYVNLTESTLKDTDNSNILLKLGFLSDVHHEAQTTDRAASEDFANAMQYFTNQNVDDVYISGDLTREDRYPYYGDLQAFKDNLDTVRNSIANAPDVYIVRGNHDIGCIANKERNPHNYIFDGVIYDINDERALYEIDKTWGDYLQDNLYWLNGYYFPGLVTEDPNTVDPSTGDPSTGDTDIDDSNENNENTEGNNNVTPPIDDPNLPPFTPNDPILLGAGEPTNFVYDASVALKACGYNVYELQDGEDELTLVVIGLPLYGGGFWSWSSQNPAYTNEEIYQLELVIRLFYNQPNTEIIVITHLPFKHNLTGNYKSVYSRSGNNAMGMDGWYNQQQYHALEQLHDFYKGVIWVEGHTHYKYELQGYKTYISFFDDSATYTSAGGNSKVECYFDNSNISCYKDVFDVHIASGAYPRWVTNNQSEDKNSESQGSLFEVHSKFIDIKGINFKDTNDTKYTNKLIPVGMYRLYFLQNKPVMSDNTVLIYNKETNSLHIRPNENL